MPCSHGTGLSKAAPALARYLWAVRILVCIRSGEANRRCHMRFLSLQCPCAVFFDLTGMYSGGVKNCSVSVSSPKTDKGCGRWAMGVAGAGLTGVIGRGVVAMVHGHGAGAGAGAGRMTGAGADAVAPVVAKPHCQLMPFAASSFVRLWMASAMSQETAHCIALISLTSMMRSSSSGKPWMADSSSAMSSSGKADLLEHRSYRLYFLLFLSSCQ